MTTRTEDIKKIRNLLKKITGRTWSVSGSNGTAYSYIRIKTQPRRLEETGELCREVNLIDQWLLGMVFNEGRPVHFQGHQITPEGRDRFIAFLSHLAFKGYTCTNVQAQAALNNSTKDAKNSAEAKVCDALRKAVTGELEDWKFLEIAQDIAHRNTILRATADRLVAEAIERFGKSEPAAEISEPELTPSAAAWLALANR